MIIHTMDYSNGKIYQLCSLLTNKIYIGSTIQSLNERLQEHKKGYKYFLEGNGRKVYSFKMLKYSDCFIELIEDYPCNSRKELERREGELQLQFINVIVNKNIAGRTKQEYCDAHKLQKIEYDKEYREVNKVKLQEYDDGRKLQKKAYRLANKVKFQEYRDGRKLIRREYNTEYHEANKDEINKRKKAHYEANKDNINQLRRERRQRMKLVNAINPT